MCAAGWALTRSRAPQSCAQQPRRARWDLIRHYIKAGINVNAADYDKRTALHIAAADGCLEAVRRTMAIFPSLASSHSGDVEGNSAQLYPVHLHCGL